VKLEIGPKDRPIGKGWKTLDVKRHGDTRVDYIGIWGALPMPFKRNTVDIIYASHVLEHVPWSKTQFALRDALRVLKRGGALEVWVPDFEVIVKAYLERKRPDTWKKLNPTDDPMIWVNGRIFAYGAPENWHKAVFDYRSLTDAFEQAGFTNVRRLETPRGYSHGVINLGVAGDKP
jgi:predicted SAM-dependent methyltransferase